MSLTPAQIADKWERNTTAARQSYIDGVNAVTVSPMQSAAAAGARWRAGLMEAFNNNAWEAGLARAGTLQDWKTKTTLTGAARLASGATAAKPRVLRFFTRWQPILWNNVQEVLELPNDTFEQRIERMVRMATLNRESAQRMREEDAR